MIDIIDKTKCCGCTACSSICPNQCIIMAKDEEGFDFPKVNISECLGCNLCSSVCQYCNPMKNDNLTIAYASKCHDDSIRMSSSSGGLFSIIAEAIICAGGIVCGAAFDQAFKEVKHIFVDSIEGLKALRASKYVQSSMANAFHDIRKTLETGRLVLFTGTPCQVSGLKHYLGNSYDNLLCIDTVCHGVPSPRLWVEYINYLESKYKGKTVNVCFRKKKEGQPWGVHRKNNRTTVFREKNQDPYMRMFLNNSSLRMSCYNCQAKKDNSYADITLGDFWGIKSIAPEFDDEKGITLLIVNTCKGKKMIDSIEKKCELLHVEYGKAAKGNPMLYESASMPEDREMFSKLLNKTSFIEIANTFTQKRRIAFRQIISESLFGTAVKHIIGKEERKFQYGLLVEIRRQRLNEKQIVKQLSVY